MSFHSIAKSGEFRKGGRLSSKDKWFLDGKEIDIVSYFKYLGCYFSSSGSFSKCVLDLTNSARRALFALKKYFAFNKEILPSIQINMFNSMIQPILNYGCEVWGLRRADPMDKFHRAFLKFILRVKKSTPNCFVYGELGVYPLFIDRQVKVISYWIKILENIHFGNENLFICKMYIELYELTITQPGTVTWASLVRDTLERCGMGNYWVAQNISDKDRFLKIFRMRLQDIYQQTWEEEVGGSSEGRLFKHVKGDFRFEPYLNIVRQSLRISITKIRLSSHALFIERGRWVNVQKNERLCQVCGVIEDEFHCLIECPRFNNERRGLLPSGLNERPHMYEFVKLLKSESAADLRRLGILCQRV